MKSFLEKITPNRMASRLEEMCRDGAEMRVLRYMLGQERIWEWVHSVGVCEDVELRACVPPFPPLELRSITAAPDLPEFLWTGLIDIKRILALYERMSARVDGTYETILDFGCGCGRMVRFLSAYGADCCIHACDLNPDHVAWCRKNLAGIHVTQSHVQPPLPYGDESLDLVYSLSVFTHLSERSASAWISEMRRVLAPGGILIATIHGFAALETIKESAGHQQMFGLDRAAVIGVLDAFEAKTFFFFPYDQATLDVAKAGAEYGNAFIHPAYVRAKWHQEGLEVLDILPGGLRGWQDIVILKRT